MRNTFVISDTHFNHENIIKYCNRPFSSVTEMNEALIKNWNDTVAMNDVVIHLGDFGLRCNLDGIIDLRRRLKGSIVFIPGNHDKLTIETYMQVFNFVCDSLVLENMLFTHKPFEHFSFTDYALNVHGHIHNNIKSAYSLDPEMYVNVSCEVLNYRPIHLDELIAKKRARNLV